MIFNVFSYSDDSESPEHLLGGHDGQPEEG